MISHAQHGEDRILSRLLHRIGARHRVAVEFGAKDGVYQSNTARLRAQGWRVVLFDRQPDAPIVTQATITRENVNAIFQEHAIPQDFDVLSIDIDGNDLWVWEALTYTPRIVVIEYNQIWPASVSVTVPYDADREWDGTSYYGASVGALCRLARRKGYRLFKSTYSNLIFVHKRFLHAGLPAWKVNVPRIGKPPDPLHRPWVPYP
jgi:hypothetical protein